jgi:hypothetical protein
VLLQHTQECNLGLGRQLPNFIQEDRPSFRQLEAAEAPLKGSREGSLLMTEQFRGDQRCGNCGTIHTHKGPRGALRPFVDGSGDEFLACAGFAGDEDG